MPACPARFAGMDARLAAYRSGLLRLRCTMTPSRDISRLLEIMAALRTPGTGCPWDLEQDFATIAPYTIEEAYEVADAIARGDLDDLCGRTRRSPAAGGVSCPHGGGTERVLVRRRGRGDHAQDDPKASACLRRQGRAIDAVGRQGRVGAHQGRGEGRTRGAAAARKKRRTNRCCRASRPDSRRWRARWNCSARRPASASTGTIRARCCTRFARKPTRSRPRSTAAMPTNLRRKPAISCSRWSIWRAMSAPIRKWRCAAPTPNSNAALVTSSAHWRRKGVRSKDASLDEMDALWNEAKEKE